MRGTRGAEHMRLGLLILGCLSFGLSGCGGNGGGSSGNFVLGPFVSRNITPQDREVELGGQRFRFPEGGTGTLRLARILQGPKAPFAGEGVYVEYTGLEPVQLIHPAPDGYPMVLAYGRVQGIFDDDIGNRDRWYPLPSETLENGEVVYDLTAEGFPPNSGSNFTRAQGDRFYMNPRHMWITKLYPGTDEMSRRLALQLSAQAYLDEFLSSLTPERRARVEEKIREKPLRLEHDGNYYKGFWWRSLGRWGRVYHPTVHVTLDGFGLPHELGHYFTHLLVGDDVQSVLEGQGSFFSEHWLGKYVGRDYLQEEYAYFIQHFLAGEAIGSPLEEPFDIFRGDTPLNKDFPGLEGFGAVMLHNLVRTKPTMRDVISGISESVPSIGMPYSRAFEIVAKGATNVNQLRRYILEALTPEEAAKFSVLMFRSGWRYMVEGRIVDDKGNPIVGATVEPLVKWGNEAYRLPSAYHATTDGQGRFRLWVMFPGDSYLRIKSASMAKPIDVSISVDWDLPTNQTVSLGDIPLVPSLRSTRYMAVSLLAFGDAEHCFKQGDPPSWECSTFKAYVSTPLISWYPEMGNVPIVWSGNTFSGSVTVSVQSMPPSPGGYIPLSTTLNSDAGEYTFYGTYDPASGVMTITVGFRGFTFRGLSGSETFTIRACRLQGSYNPEHEVYYFRTLAEKSDCTYADYSGENEKKTQRASLLGFDYVSGGLTLSVNPRTSSGSTTEWNTAPLAPPIVPLAH